MTAPQAAEHTPGTGAARPRRPAPRPAPYLGLLALAGVLIVVFSATTTSTLRLSFGLFAVPLYAGLAGVLVVAVIGLGWRLRAQPLPVLGALAVIAMCWWGGSGIGFTLAPLWEDLGRAERVLAEFLDPNWRFVIRVWDQWVVTLAMAIVATTVGCAVGLLLALGASPVSSPTKLTSQVIKATNSVIRSIPDIGYGLLFVAMLGGTAGGAGPMAGIMALVMFNIGIVAKLTGETIDSVDPGPLEAADATGATLIQRNRQAVIPQILPGFFSYTLYTFELNIRASVVLGIVGAGGVGQVITVQLSHFNYSNIAAVMIALVVVVLAVDYLSLTIRRRLT